MTEHPPRRLWVSLLVWLVVSAAQPALTWAADLEAIERILNTARAFALANVEFVEGQEVEINLGQLDSRLQLRRCDHPPAAQFAPGARREGHTTINVRCSAPVSWSLFVPAQIERHLMVVVLNRPVSREQIIDYDDIRLERQAVSSLTNGYFTEATAVVGMAADRRLMPGQVLTSDHLVARQLIERGQEVLIISERPGLVVRMKGIALEGGAKGERIRVRNRTSKRIIEGYVEASGTVRVAL
ncbi:flagella basal body P-ring formation protein FlgA [Allochromatium warmingii]|uniref:Flagella basal body P-ring formation protein FlgA n=1 Tax=Allochromatium warmingii TaxID=61595 RepID=A0A1H3CME2_ALLWA|nr:flagellar basal body P-ring formation chaperone FlgA [Allochromatium warmingii]SDX55266.1 flagella basal body P-ring formation protein FlgA [Allochromatium warmingii]